MASVIVALIINSKWTSNATSEPTTSIPTISQPTTSNPTTSCNKVIDEIIHEAITIQTQLNADPDGNKRCYELVTISDINFVVSFILFAFQIEGIGSNKEGLIILIVWILKSLMIPLFSFDELKYIAFVMTSFSLYCIIYINVMVR